MDAVHPGHGSSGPFGFSVIPIVSGGFWEEEATNTKDNCPDETNAHGNSVGSCAGEPFSSIVDAAGSEHSDGDEELITSEVQLLAEYSLVMGLDTRLVLRGRKEKWETIYEITAPLTETGGASAMYIGTRTDRPPTARPAHHLPIATSTQLPGPTAICAITPMQNIRHQGAKVALRPYLLARGPAIKHPHNVPMDNWRGNESVHLYIT